MQQLVNEEKGEFSARGGALSEGELPYKVNQKMACRDDGKSQNDFPAFEKGHCRRDGKHIQHGVQKQVADLVALKLGKPPWLKQVIASEMANQNQYV